MKVGDAYEFNFVERSLAMSVYQALMLMVAFATLVVAILNAKK